jgi:hypothetical protein
MVAEHLVIEKMVHGPNMSRGQTYLALASSVWLRSPYMYGGLSFFGLPDMSGPGIRQVYFFSLKSGNWG